MAELVNVTELGPGKVYIHENQLYSVLDINRNKTAMAKMKVKMKVQNLRSGAIEEVMFFGGDRVELAYLERRLCNSFIPMKTLDISWIRILMTKFKFLMKEFHMN